MKENVQVAKEARYPPLKINFQTKDYIEKVELSFTGNYIIDAYPNTSSHGRKLG